MIVSLKIHYHPAGLGGAEGGQGEGQGLGHTSKVSSFSGAALFSPTKMPVRKMPGRASLGGRGDKDSKATTTKTDMMRVGE